MASHWSCSNQTQPDERNEPDIAAIKDSYYRFREKVAIAKLKLYAARREYEAMARTIVNAGYPGPARLEKLTLHAYPELPFDPPESKFLQLQCEAILQHEFLGSDYSHLMDAKIPKLKRGYPELFPPSPPRTQSRARAGRERQTARRQAGYKSASQDNGGFSPLQY